MKDSKQNTPKKVKPILNVSKHYASMTASEFEEFFKGRKEWKGYDWKKCFIELGGVIPK